MCDVKGEVGVSWTLKYTATVSMLYVYLGTSCYRLQGSKMNSTVLLIKGSSCRISIAAVRRRGEKMEGKKVSSSLLLICSMFDQGPLANMDSSLGDFSYFRFTTRGSHLIG